MPIRACANWARCRTPGSGVGANIVPSDREHGAGANLRGLIDLSLLMRHVASGGRSMPTNSYDDRWLLPRRQTDYPSWDQLPEATVHGRREATYLVLAATFL